MIGRTLCALLCGSVIGLIVVQQDPMVQQCMISWMRDLYEDDLDCAIAYSGGRLDLLAGRIEWKNMRVMPLKRGTKDWQWRCKRCVFRTSWPHFFRHRIAEAHMRIYGFEADTTVDADGLTIGEFIDRVVDAPPPPIPTQLKSMVVDNARLHLHHEQTGACGTIHFSCRGRAKGQQFISTISVHDGALSLPSGHMVEQMAGEIVCQAVPLDSNASTNFRARCSFDAVTPNKAREELFFAGSWCCEGGRLSLSNAEESFQLDPFIFTRRNDQLRFRLIGRAPLGHLSAWCAVPGSALITGNGVLTMQSDGDLTDVRGDFVCEDMGCTQIPDLNAATKISFINQAGRWSGVCNVRASALGELTGDWHWSEATKKGGMHMTNAAAISVPGCSYWKIDSRAGQLNVTVQDDHIEIGHTVVARNKLLDKEISAQGTVDMGTDGMTLKGNLGPASYVGTIDRRDPSCSSRISVVGTDQQPYISAALQGTQFEATIDMQMLRDLWYYYSGRDWQGDGSFTLQAHGTDTGIAGELRLKDGMIRMPQTYNFIQGVRATWQFDIPQRTLSVSDLLCSLHEGSLHSEHARIIFEPDGKCSFVHAPFIFDHCLFNMRRDLFAVLSGRVLLSQRTSHDPLCIDSDIVIDRAQCNENLFSEDIQKRVLQQFGNATTRISGRGRAPHCVVRVTTREPILVDTPLLQTAARAALTITKDTGDFDVDGTITLDRGSLVFPYKPLQIVRGQIHFSPGKLHDPVVELEARNRIKNYDVRLQVGGTFKEHHIALESVPSLSEEQVASLLLVGSCDDTLNTMVPALLAQNVRGLIFGAHTKDDSSRRKRSSLRRPFNITLRPSFVDQSGRGGLRASLELEINDRWRALLQKNFNLSEDTRFEVEYAVSDDVSVRAIRNERGYHSPGVEMRVKL